MTTTLAKLKQSQDELFPRTELPEAVQKWLTLEETQCKIKAKLKSFKEALDKLSKEALERQQPNKPSGASDSTKDLFRALASTAEGQRPKKPKVIKPKKLNPKDVVFAHIEPDVAEALVKVLEEIKNDAAASQPTVWGQPTVKRTAKQTKDHYALLPQGWRSIMAPSGLPSLQGVEGEVVVSFASCKISEAEMLAIQQQIRERFSKRVPTNEDVQRIAARVHLTDRIEVFTAEQKRVAKELKDKEKVEAIHTWMLSDNAADCGIEYKVDKKTGEEKSCHFQTSTGVLTIQRKKPKIPKLTEKEWVAAVNIATCRLGKPAMTPADTRAFLELF